MKNSPSLKYPAMSLMFSWVFLIVSVLWTAILSGMMAWHLSDTKRHIEHIAHEAAAENIEKDVLYRAWASEHGGVYVPMSGKTTPNPLLKNIKERDITTPSGRKLTLVNPSDMTRHVHELKRRKSGIVQHITSRRPLRPENRPDAWEWKALDAIAAGKEEFGEVTTMDGAPYYRLMVPLFVEEPCLHCHASQGYKLGELRGGISASLPLSLFRGVSHEHIISEARHFGSVWLLGMIGMLLARPFIRRRIREGERAEQMLQQSEERYRTIVSTALEGIITIDKQLNVTFANPSMLEMLGRTEGEVLGRSIFEFIDEDEFEDQKAQIELRKKGLSTQFERRFRRGDGSLLWALGSAAPIRDEMGKFCGAFGMFADITERKNAAEAIAANERQLRTIFDTSQAGIILVNPKGEITLANNRMTELFKCPMERLIGSTYPEHVHPDQRMTGDQKMRQLISGEIDSVALERHYIAADGSDFWGFLSGRRLEDGNGNLLALVGIIADITERKKAEEAVHSSEEKYRYLFTNNPVPMWVYDEQTLAFLAVNDFAVEHYGYSREEFLGMTIRDIRPPEELPHLYNTLKKTAGKKMRGDIIAKHRKKNGALIDVEIVAHEIVFEGRPAVLVLATDITQRMRAEEGLRESERRYRETLENAHMIAVQLDKKGVVTFANDFLCAMSGWAREEILGRNWMDVFIPGEQREELRRVHETNVSGRGLIREYENEIITKTGQRRHISWTNSITRDEKNQIAGITALGIDVTERKRWQEALVESEHRFREMVEDAPLAFCIIGRDGRIEYINRKHVQMLGFSIEDIPFLERWWALAYPDPEKREEVMREWNALAGAVRDGGLQDQKLERRVACKDGTQKDVEILLTSVGEKLFAIFYDITERKLAEEQRERLEAQLMQAQKMESIGLLAGGVAHDINNMLMPILGYAEILSRKLPAGDSRREETEAIIRSAERVRDVTRQLLAFARKQTMEMRPLDLNQVVEGFESMLRRTLRENIEVDMQYADSLPIIMGDAGQIEQVVLNLAINAQDAMPGGGTLLIETSLAVIDEAFVHAHEGSVPGEYVALSLRDTGVGMDGETMSRIFEPFFTTKEVGRGTGLGLSMVYGIVKQHGGYLAVSSEPGKGSIFRTYFPVAGAMAGAVSDDFADDLKGGTETLLIVEDQKEVLDITARILEECGYRVLRAVDAETAVSIAEAHPGPIELLVADVVMPNMNGRELFETLCRIKTGLKVLYMSGYAADVISTHGVLHSGTNFIQKPFSISALAGKVRAVLDG